MKFVAALSLLMASAVQGAQDTAYYPGFSNPNTNDEMYYREAINVIQDVQSGEFDSLYIKYHSCVWSEYGSGENQEGGEESGCGGDGGDEFWYLGRTQCFRANVAYSLYGIKAGKSSSSPCSSGNYINSFFTTGGIESFGDNVGVAYGNYGVSTTCTATYVGGNNNNNNNNNNGDDHGHNQLYYPDYTSTTLGCSASGQFIAATFQGAYCDGNHFLSNDGAISELNSELESLGCLKIYDSANGNNNNNNGDNGDGGYDFGDSGLNLLAYSSSCSHTEYPNRCPDPHGVKRARDQKLFKYAQSHYRAVPLIMPIMSTILLIGAAILYCLANGIRDSAKRRAVESTTGEAVDPTIYEKFSTSFNRVATDVSQRTRTFTEKLAQYAEEEEDDVGGSPMNSYEAPDATTSANAAPGAASALTPVSSMHSAKSNKSNKSEKAGSVAPSVHEEEAAAQTEVANAMLAEKGVTPKAAGDESGTKYKRPRLAKFSKWIRGRFGRKKNVSTTDI